LEISADQEKLIRQVAEDFKKAMQIRGSMNVRVAKRVTAILRIGMVSFGIVTIILILMLYAFTSKMSEMIVVLDTMNTQFTTMSEDMAVMRVTLTKMQHNIAYVPAITHATVGIRNTVGGMRAEVDGMRGTVASVNDEVYGITNQVSNMNLQMRSLDPAVQHIGRDVYRMSGPMRLFNDFNPFD
jgi:hypothetical protein